MTWHDYADQVLRYYYDADCRQSLSWTPTSENVSFPFLFVSDCSDLFGWAVADAEPITIHDLDLLGQCYEDLKELHEESFLPELYAARRRDRQPFDLWMRNNTVEGSPLRLLFAKLPDQGAM